MQRAALLRAAAGGPPPSDFPGFRKYSSKENENLACFGCVLRYCSSRENSRVLGNAHAREIRLTTAYPIGTAACTTSGCCCCCYP